MADQAPTIVTKVTDKSFDDVIAEFDIPKEVAPGNMMKDAPTSKVFDEKPKTAEETAAEAKAQAEAAAEIEKKRQEDEIKKVAEKSVQDKKDVVKDIDSVLDRKDDLDHKTDDTDKDSDNSSLFKALEALTEEGVIFPFNEDKPLSDYTADDFKELVKANIDHHKKEALDTEIGEFFQSLPVELQYAAKYVADGGTDLKSLFKALAATEEIKNLDVKTQFGKESVIREYYRAIDWGTEEEITEELERLKEAGEPEVEKIANKFKPKLEKMQQDLTEQQLARQEKAKQAGEQEMNLYLDNAHEAIKAGKLGELQLDKKTQAALWTGLTQPTHQTRRGAVTNKLGHLLEKYQYTEPNFEKIYKVLWLLEDEKGFEEAMTKRAKSADASDTARILRTEQSKKISTGKQAIEDAASNLLKKKKLERPGATPSFLQGLKINK